MAKKLVIKVSAGADAPERCSQAFTVVGAQVFVQEALADDTQALVY
ncbi:hypothetical protein SUDANB140_03553 [Streptomyces sp. enrichment culture]